MRYIKKFEEYDDLKEGDYVYLDSTDNINHAESLNKFLKNHIGVVEEAHLRTIFVYFIFNDDDNEEIKNEFNHVIPFKKKYILLHDKDLENLKIKIDSLKYNI